MAVAFDAAVAFDSASYTFDGATPGAAAVAVASGPGVRPRPFVERRLRARVRLAALCWGELVYPARVGVRVSAGQVGCVSRTVGWVQPVRCDAVRRLSADRSVVFRVDGCVSSYRTVHVVVDGETFTARAVERTPDRAAKKLALLTFAARSK